MLKYRNVPISVALILLVLVTSLPSSGLSVGGTMLEKEVVPGDHITHEMSVGIRSTEKPVDIRVEILGYGQSSTVPRIALNASDDTSPYTARPFLKVSPDSFHLEPGKRQTLTLEGDIPKDVGSGGRYALVRVHTLPMGNGSVGFIAAVDTTILLTISGSEIQDKGEIESLKPEEPVSADKQKMSLVLKNTGNHHFYPLIRLLEKDKDGNIKANASFPIVDPLLPPYTRSFDFSLSPETPLKPGTYSVNATVSTKNGSILAFKETSLEIKT